MKQEQAIKLLEKNKIELNLDSSAFTSAAIAFLTQPGFLTLYLTM